MIFSYHSVDLHKLTPHPSSQSVLTGAEATFKVEATGDDLTFQWQKDSKPVPAGVKTSFKTEARGDKLTYQDGSDVYNDSNYSGTDTDSSKKSISSHYRCVMKNEVEKGEEVSNLGAECLWADQLSDKKFHSAMSSSINI